VTGGSPIPRRLGEVADALTRTALRSNREDVFPTGLLAKMIRELRFALAAEREWRRAT